MKEALNHWKEAVGVALYFLFLAYFTPKAKELGWGIQGMMFCIVAGAVLIGLVYLLLKGIGQYIEDHREEVSSYKEYMGIGSSTPHVELAAIAGEYTNAELDALLADNPYASAELFSDDKYTRLLPSVDTGDDEETRLVDEPEDDLQAPGGKVAAIIGENPRRRLDLADNFQPDAEAPLATGVFFVAMPGSGKTVAMALFLEQYIFLFRLACVIFCLEGDLRSIVQSGFCPRGMIAGPDDMPSMAYVVKHRVQLVVDLQQCRKPGEEFVNYELAGQLIASTVKELLNAQATIKAAGQQPLPCLLALDETQMWGPQNPPSYLKSDTYKDLLDTLIVVATRGRKYSVIPFLAAQRIARVHKDIIAGCETRILGKTDLHNDIACYREYVSKEVISDQGIRSLARGQMVVCMNGKRLIVQFKNRKSEHTSHSPHLTGALNNPVERIPSEILAASAAASRRVEAVQSTPIPSYVPHSEPVTNGSLEKATRQPLQFPREVRGKRAAGLASELQAALEVYQPGMTYHDLGRAMGCSDTEARILWRELKQRGLLHATTGSESEPEIARPGAAPVPQKALNQAELERALRAYDEGNTTIDELAVALGMSPWNARPFYAAVKKLRKNAG
jgi:hypothetical protein